MIYIRKTSHQLGLEQSHREQDGDGRWPLHQCSAGVWWEEAKGAVAALQVRKVIRKERQAEKLWECIFAGASWSARHQVMSIMRKTDLAGEFCHCLDFVAVVTEIFCSFWEEEKCPNNSLLPGWMKALPGLHKNKTICSSICLPSKTKQKLLHQICWKILASQVVANQTCPELSFGSGAVGPVCSALVTSRCCSTQRAQQLLCATL